MVIDHHDRFAEISVSMDDLFPASVDREHVAQAAAECVAMLAMRHEKEDKDGQSPVLGGSRQFHRWWTDGDDRE